MHEASAIIAAIWSGPAARNSARSCSCSRFQTPAACHLCNRRRQVIPRPRPISRGRSSHGMPALSTNRMPVRQAQSETRGRPPLELGGGAGGNNGSTFAHHSSVTSILAIRSSVTNSMQSVPSADRRKGAYC